MFPVQILVVLSMMIIINQAATLNYDNQKSFITIYDADTMKYVMLNNKTYNANGTNSEITHTNNFHATDLIKNVNNSNKTFLTDLNKILSELPRGKVVDFLKGCSIGVFGKVKYCP
ncbi:unnamed protein product [Macrosiphum euphorbiae]|uniref:Uncharacterized protein n=1 Tax=Macrosiphum euphorbiae TaxID=13131 RepID=A0AAV0WCW6_9HEMI|nr:unnamed protein product [Macrosiphum euphorbiae]